MKILSIDPSYRKIGVFYDNTAIFIENKCPGSYEDYFLYNLEKILRSEVKGKVFLCIEYTYVPYLKVMSVINRVIGVILSALHKRIDGWAEIDMNKVYSFFKVKGKTNLKKIILPELRKTSLRHYIITNSGVKVKEKKVLPKNLPQDCIDAFSLNLYIKKLNEKERLK